ncbi:FecR domain-containing protein [Parapedobacter sp. DT-150]|uniref:FecR domain-containing protein n=1 Tax=Parapedobacter sp. DT-150 TaxID=3396162 RepID=UPI003F1B7E55
MEHEDIKDLLKRYLAGECTPEERIRVEQWYEQLEINPEGLSRPQLEDAVAEVRSRLALKPAHRVMWYRYGAAVAAATLVATITYFYFAQPSQVGSDTPALATAQQDIAPGGNRAILKLADGTEITLDDRQDGKVAQEGGHSIYKNTDGELVYQLADQRNTDAGIPKFNTMSTPRGGQYHLVLPDGTKVWLNAASTLTYAVSKSANERLVTLEGEAYFEVTKDPRRPFRVKSKGQVVEVLGTHFNINSYADEPDVKTTLVEGLVKVIESNHQRMVMLQPGQQAALSGSSRLSVRPVNTADAIAWKNGKFNFNDSDIGSIMRQLSRWYDVEVIFEGKMPNITLWGGMYRNTNASKALEILLFYDLDYRIETVDGAKRIVIQ